MRRCRRALFVLVTLLPVVVPLGRSARADLPVPVVLIPGWHGVARLVRPAHHGAVPGDPQTIALVTAALGYRPAEPPPGAAGSNLTGPATIRLEYAEIADDHDRWTDDENRFAVSVDPDGGGDGFVPLGGGRRHAFRISLNGVSGLQPR